jgi:hypothetical protein
LLKAYYFAKTKHPLKSTASGVGATTFSIMTLSIKAHFVTLSIAAI